MSLSLQALGLIIRSVMTALEDLKDCFIDEEKLKRSKANVNPINNKWKKLGIPTGAGKMDAAMKTAHNVAMRIRSTKDFSASGNNESLSSLKTAENPLGLAGAKVLANCLDPTILRWTQST